MPLQDGPTPPAGPVPRHPLLDGLPEIGRGEYSIVLDKGDGERVLKVVSSPADYFLYTADDRPTGPHSGDLCGPWVIGRASPGYPFHLIEMEHLLADRRRHQAADVAQGSSIAISKAASNGYGLVPTWAGLRSITLRNRHPGASSRQSSGALKALSDSPASGTMSILNAENLMIRQDGTLVSPDPVFIS